MLNRYSVLCLLPIANRLLCSCNISDRLSKIYFHLLVEWIKQEYKFLNVMKKKATQIALGLVKK